MTILWYFDGTQYLGGEYMFTLDPAWKIGGSADVNGDGHTDLLVSSTATGDAGVWYLNGAQYQDGQYIGTMQAGWVLAHVADFDGDLKADAVIRETASGVAFLEFLDGAQVVGEEWFFNIEPAWQLGPAGEQFQKAAGSPAPLVNRPLPPGFTKPTFERLAGRSILAPRRLSDIGRIPSPADHKGPIPPGPTPPTGKRFAKSMVGATPAALYYVTPDHLGTPRAITRPTDNRIVWRWDNTEPFGNSPPNENPLGVGNFAFNLRFPGQYFDAETGTHYNYFRDYDPAVGRYVQSDPIGLDGGLNTFSYAYDNPLIFYDAEGKVAAQTVVLCVAGALTAYGAYKLYSKYSCQRDCQVDCQIKHSCKDGSCPLGEGNTGPLNACRRECIASCWLGMGKKGPMGPTPKSPPNNPSPLPRN